jgi:hypothetical protein
METEEDFTAFPLGNDESMRCIWNTTRLRKRVLSGKYKLLQHEHQRRWGAFLLAKRIEFWEENDDFMWITRHRREYKKTGRIISLEYFTAGFNKTKTRKSVTTMQLWTRAGQTQIYRNIK